MNKTKKMSLLFATLGILAFSLIPVANAGVPRFMQRDDSYNNLLMPWWWNDLDWEFSTSEDLFFRLGWATDEWELENDVAPKNPWKIKLFINDEEINLQRYGVKADKKAGVVKISYWYHVFGPGYFEVDGEYLLRWEFWVRKPYQGDAKNYWRIWVDYEGIYFDPGFEFIVEYYLNIVE